MKVLSINNRFLIDYTVSIQFDNRFWFLADSPSLIGSHLCNYAGCRQSFMKVCRLQAVIYTIIQITCSHLYNYTDYRQSIIQVTGSHLYNYTDYRRSIIQVTCTGTHLYNYTDYRQSFIQLYRLQAVIYTIILITGSHLYTNAGCRQSFIH